MNRYEAMFLLKPDLAQDDLQKSLSQVHDIITKHNGSLDQVQDLGKQKLAYAIKKQNEGVYHLINFHMDSGSISKIKRLFNLNESILRTLIVKA